MGFKVVGEKEVFVIERLGAYHKTIGAGLHFLIPLYDRVRNRITTDEIEVVINHKDHNVKIVYQIIDPKLYTYIEKNPEAKLEKIVLESIDQIKIYEENISLKALRDELENRVKPDVLKFGLQINRLDITK